jgi:putative sigma-54 modulation protein
VLAKVELRIDRTRRQDQRAHAEITVDVDGTVLRSEERAATPTAAIDQMVETLDRRLIRLKGRLYANERAKKAGRNVSVRTLDALAAGGEEGEQVEVVGQVVRVKRFPIKPMTVEEAAFQMEALGHDFFLFLNTETNTYNVLYKRKGGGYGLIQPEPL